MKHKFFKYLSEKSFSLFDCVAIHYIIVTAMIAKNYGAALILIIVCPAISLGLTTLTKKLEKKDGNP